MARLSGGMGMGCFIALDGMGMGCFIALDGMVMNVGWPEHGMLSMGWYSHRGAHGAAIRSCIRTRAQLKKRRERLTI